MAAGWSTNFTAPNDGVFTVDDGDISHCPQCIDERADHVKFGSDGLVLELDQSPCNATAHSCCVNGTCAAYAAGHVRSANFQAFGRFTFVARPSFPPLGSGAPPQNAFACLTTSYYGSPHHEVASCFHGDSPTEVSLAFWSEPDNSVGKIITVDTGVLLHNDFHTYEVVWTPLLLTLSLDGVEIANATARAANTTIPSIPGQVLLINRVMSNTYDGDASVALRFASYVPLS